MPLFFQYFTMIFPARWFMQIARDTFLKGSSLLELCDAFLGAHRCSALLIIRMATRTIQKGSRAMNRDAASVLSERS